MHLLLGFTLSFQHTNAPFHQNTIIKARRVHNGVQLVRTEQKVTEPSQQAGTVLLP